MKYFFVDYTSQMDVCDDGLLILGGPMHLPIST
jgi:hypothetical protein